MARIDSPALCQINIRLFQDISFELPQLCKFIPLLDALRSPTCAHVIHFRDFVRVSFFEEGRPEYEHYDFETTGGWVGRQLVFVAQIARHLSPLLSGVRNLGISSDQRLPVEEGDEDNLDEWLAFFEPFSHVTEVEVWGQGLVLGVMLALDESEGMDAEVLPELTTLRLDGCPVPLTEQFVAKRRLSTGHTVLVELIESSSEGSSEGSIEGSSEGSIESSSDSS